MEEIMASCPLCGSENVRNYDDKIKCFMCNKTYDKNVIQLIKEVEEIITVQGRKDLEEQILNTKDFKTFLNMLNAVKNMKRFCPYCGDKIDLECKICPSCGVLIRN